MRINSLKAMIKTALRGAAVLLLGAGAAGAQQVNLTAASTTAVLPDGAPVPMWGYSCAGSSGGATCTTLNPSASGWSPVVITVTTGQDLSIALNNQLSVPTSLVIVGQVGGGLGTPGPGCTGGATCTDSPDHTQAQATTTWPIAGGPGATAPTQGKRVQSFSTEVAAGASTTTPLTWKAPRPGTYLLESGTHPSIQAPMGLIGVVVVTNAGAKTAYPTVSYDAEVPLLFSEIDPVQNMAVSNAVTTPNFSETKVWSGLAGGCGNKLGTDGLPNPAFGTCYPPVVNYKPLYYLINGVAFDKTHPTNSLFPTAPATGIATTGKVLLRFVNAGLRMHIPSVVGSQTVGTAADGSATKVGGFSLIAEDGNVLPGTPRVQNEVYMAPGKTYDVMVNAPDASASALAVYDRELSLSGNKTSRDAGMLAYVSVNGANLPLAPVFNATAQAVADAYPSIIAGQTFQVTDPAKGLIANDSNIYNVRVVAQPAQGTLSLNPDGTFSYVASGSWSEPDSFSYCGNGASTGAACAVVTLSKATVEDAAGITVMNTTFHSNVATFLKVGAPGILAGAKDAAGYPLKVDLSSISAPSGWTLTPDPNADGGFIAIVPASTSGGTYSFTYKAVNSQGTKSASAATATLNFASPSNLKVTVLDGNDKKTGISDYRWIIEEDRTFYIDPNNTTNTGGTSIVPTFGTNFHTSYMPVVAKGCTGDLSCASGQMVLDTTPGSPTYGQHIKAACDQGNGICHVDATEENQIDPGMVHLDPTKRYYLSILPGDAADPLAGDAAVGHSHGMGGAPITFNQTAVTVYAQPTPFPPAKLSVYVFEDDFPLNGEQDAGGGVDILAPNEPGLGGFNVTIMDDAGGPGDATGQVDYDMFNQPLSNSLAGTLDPATGLDACPIGNSRTGTNADGSNDATQTGLTGTIVTCPKYESGVDSAGNPILSPLAGQAIVANMMPGRYGIVATPAADRIAKGEEWLQTNTLDGQKAHDSFLRVGEAGYFQEFGPANYHVAIGFANPKIINARLKGVCAGTDINIDLKPSCSPGNTLKGKVTTERMSRTPDERLYSSGSNDSFGFTQCFVSFGDPDGEDFAFTKCNADGTFTLSGLPDGDWRVTVFDQWNDMLVDGLSTPVRLSAGNNANCPGQGSAAGTCDMGDIATTQWQANITTSTFFDTNGDGVREDKEPGLSLVATNVRFRDGSFSNFNSTDLSGNAGFNEEFPLFNWYVIETDQTRYKNTGTHVVYDAGGPADGACGGSTACGSSTIAQNLANTYEQNPLPADLHFPGSIYCDNGDCSGTNTPAGVYHSTSRVDPPWVLSEGWQGFSGQNNFLEFGKAPFAENENGGIRGHVVYASTRPFDDPTLLLQLSWEPLVPNVTMNLYKEGTAPDGSTSLQLVDSTKTTSWDDWAQGFRSDGIPNMNCPGQGNADTSSPGSDPFFFFTLYNQPEFLDSYSAAHNGTTAHDMPHNAQFKCFDGMHNWNQLQPAPYDGLYQFPSTVDRNPQTGVPTGTGTAVNPTGGALAGSNCTICVPNPVDGTPMLPAGKYVVEMIVPPGYELVKEEDKNILIGDTYIAPVTVQFPGVGGSVYILPDQATVAENNNGLNSQNQTTNLGRTTFPSTESDTGQDEFFWPCVGEARVVPDFISLFPGSAEVAPFAGATRHLCDRKEVTLTNQASTQARFYVFTPTHVAAHFTGVITDDFTSEFDPFSPQFGEKFAPPNLPIAFKDWTGTEVSRVYSDQWGAYNGLTYSTWEVNPPNPTGYAPQMMVTCMNDPGTGSSPDPLYNPDYSQFCYELPFMPGQTQYMDTPVVPTSAFASAGYNNPDCAYPDHTPAVKEVDGDGIGPWVGGASGSGALSGVTLTAGGSGYTSAPVVHFSGTGGATATATISGIVNKLTLTGGGTGFTSVPSVSFVGGGGSGAAASATITGKVASAQVTNGGGGYTSTPAVVFNNAGTGGSGATGTAHLHLFGYVGSVNVSNGGSGYTSTNTTVTFGAPPRGGTRATGTAVISGGRITGITITNPGAGYTSAPTITITPAHTTATRAVAAAVMPAEVSTVTINNGGTGYTSAPAISFTGGGGTGAVGTTTLSSFVNSLTLTAGGSGYTSAPTVVIAGPGGSGATATDTILGSVVAVTLNTPGSGYLTAPTVTFTGGAGTGAAATAGITGGTLTITALGDQLVNNNAYSGPAATKAPYNNKTITRHYDFGSSQGTVTIGKDATGKPIPATVTSWGPTSIKVTVPSGVPACPVQQQAQFGGSNALCGELVVTTASGQQSIDTVTVTIGGKSPTLVSAQTPMTQFGPGALQSAIDNAQPGDLLIVQPGVYNEMVLMWKPVRLQGVGAASSVINANTQPEGKMDPWRQKVNCVFGLALNGQPSTANNNANPGSNPFDPSGSATCGGWPGFVGSPSNPQVDRLPLEGILGWDTTVNGNLAQLLQEPTLMGAYEGAGITVLGKGVNIPAGSANIFGSGSESAFPTGTTLLTSGNCTTSRTNTTNPYPSNFQCNPSSIDGLSVTNSSQGGGGIFVHAWGHNLQIANNRVYNNTGTLTGGVTIGQGEAPDAYLLGDAGNADPGSCEAGGPQLGQLPYCFNLNVNLHNNSVSQNSSIGDELFSSTPAGAGGVTMCVGADYYKFSYNWICGNLSTGDGGGLVHLGFIKNGDIEHNSILFNQSTNPTVPTNGGGLIVMGAPPDGLTATGLECGNTAADADCTPGLSDGTGPGLIVNANLFQGNAAESGSGGGIRLQGVNGTEVVAFPRTPAQWNTVKITNNIIDNNVAGWDGAGISILDALNVDIINNTIMSNDTTASAGVLFNTLGAPLSSSQGPTCSSNCGTVSAPQPAGLVTMQHSAVLASNIPSTTTCPAGHAGPIDGGTYCRNLSYPKLENNVFWQNRAFYIGVGGAGQGFINQQNVVTLHNAFTGTVASSQPVAAASVSNGGGMQITGGTGACVSDASFWDIGVRGDTGPLGHTGNILLNPTFSILTNTTGYASSNKNSNPNVISQYCNGSRTPPEFQSNGYQVPPGISDASVPNPYFNLTPAATVDEGNNWINISWGPLALTNAVTGAALGNYGPTQGAPEVNLIASGTTNYGDAPSTDFYGNNRKTNNAVDAGAVELISNIPVPTLTSISPTSGVRGTSVPVTLTGTALTGTSAITVSGTLITVTNINVVNATSVTATFVIDPAAALTTRTVSVTTLGGASNTVNFTVVRPPAPVLTSITPNTGRRGTQVPVTIVGTNLTGVTALNGAGSITAGALTINAAGTQINTTLTISLGAALGNHTLSVTGPGGNSNTVNFTVTGATLAFAGPTPALTTLIANTTTKSGTITVTNSNVAGATSITLSAAPAFTKTAGNGTFSLTGGTCASGTVLNVGASCTVIVQYVPPAGSGLALLSTGQLTMTAVGLAGAGNTQTDPLILGN